MECRAELMALLSMVLSFHFILFFEPGWPLIPDPPISVPSGAMTPCGHCPGLAGASAATSALVRNILEKLAKKIILYTAQDRHEIRELLLFELPMTTVGSSLVTVNTERWLCHR